MAHGPRVLSAMSSAILSLSFPFLPFFVWSENLHHDLLSLRHNLHGHNSTSSHEDSDFSVNYFDASRKANRRKLSSYPRIRRRQRRHRGRSDKFRGATNPSTFFAQGTKLDKTHRTSPGLNSRKRASTSAKVYMGPFVGGSQIHKVIKQHISHSGREDNEFLKICMGRRRSKALRYSFPFDDASPQRALGTAPCCLVSKEETATDYVYKVDAPLPEEEVRVEISWGRTLRVIGPGDALMAKVRLPRNHKARASGATASVNRNRVITIRVPKREPPRKWYQDIGLRFRTIFIAISETH